MVVAGRLIEGRAARNVAVDLSFQSSDLNPKP